MSSRETRLANIERHVTKRQRECLVRLLIHITACSPAEAEDALSATERDFALRGAEALSAQEQIDIAESSAELKSVDCRRVCGVQVAGCYLRALAAAE